MISLSVGFLDSLHDPSAYVAPHDISDAAVPVNEHALTAPPGFFPSLVCRASTVSRDIAFSPVPSDSSGQSPVPSIIRAGVKYVLSNTNTNTKTKIRIFQIQIQIFCSTLIQIQIQIHRFKYKYKYVQSNISAETVQIQNRAIL